MKGWFFDHWALILQREDSRYLTVHYHIQGLEVVQVRSLETAKFLVARSANATADLVALEPVGPSPVRVKDVIVRALRLTEHRSYSFLTYNCRHFVVELLA